MFDSLFEGICKATSARDMYNVKYKVWSSIIGLAGSNSTHPRWRVEEFKYRFRSSKSH